MTSANLNVAQCFFSATLCSQKGATVLQGCLLQDQEHLPDTQIMEAATTIFLDWLSVEGFGIGIGSGWNLCRVCSVSVPMSISDIALAMLEIFRCALREQTHKNAPPALNRGSSPEEISFRQSMEPVDAATSNCI